MIYLALFAVSLGNVSVRAFQQINVTHGHYRRIPATSYVFATFDALVFLNLYQVVSDDASVYIAILAMGTGGWMGCFLSMWTTKHLNRRAGL